MMTLFQKLNAKIRRKFWTTCPRCHKPFGGHQPHGHQVTIEGVSYRIVCGDCLKIADQPQTRPVAIQEE